MITIDFQDETNSVDEAFVDMIQRIIHFAGEKEEVNGDAEVSVSFVDNKNIQEINRNYRQKDEPTDVISFAMQELGEDELNVLDENMPLMLGDIVISVDKAKEQAEEYNHSLEREFGFLALHGFLHLLGYDHLNEEDEKKMFGRQEEILYEFGLQRS
ncbi:rRNA maturation RNase YbeY [Halobacillus karajensis]|uniref:Endoribonuclease YbeY n=1 Tax=Halobacillus karajensis TaxID=195088 RepID=A0A024P7Q4_9BACI|nr:rRNA maturation RNase YbeY [Halobacillus karajensis]CDQ18037.1 Endoribonuclease YbeY [Halobacillus karajensis]CDQ24387.1 Endoribonuclease YbeY [Halobacillus karajensis]CDQ29365.1 Endoribonuclease YbeY [Halobacillus karajensis]